MQGLHGAGQSIHSWVFKSLGATAAYAWHQGSAGRSSRADRAQDLGLGLIPSALLLVWASGLRAPAWWRRPLPSGHPVLGELGVGGTGGGPLPWGALSIRSCVYVARLKLHKMAVGFRHWEAGCRRGFCVKIVHFCSHVCLPVPPIPATQKRPHREYRLQ